MIGKILGNRYEIVEKIGGGGMALVYKAKCNLLNRYVAVKVLRSEFTSDKDIIEKFKKESQAAASLSHPNIVNVYDVGEEGEIYYIVMEYIKGKTLKELIQEKEILTLEEIANYTRQVALALQHAHNNHVIHRDIKPHNIMITEDNRAKVTDFGIALAATSSTITNMGNVIGSVHYFSPEQARGGYIDEKSDLYSLGIVMYEMATGKVPFEGDSPVAIALKHIQQEPETPTEINPHISRNLEKIILKLIQKDQASRYQNTQDLIEDINRLKKDYDENHLPSNINHEDSPTQIIPRIKEEDIISTRQEPVKDKKRKNKMVIASAILAALIAAGLFTFGLFYLSSLFQSEEFELPDFVGMNIEEVRKDAEKLGLNLKEQPREDNKVPADEIINQNPAGGIKVKPGFTIDVVVSIGSSPISVPDLLYKMETEVSYILENSSLAVGHKDERYSEFPKGVVIEQSPRAGSPVSDGTVVNYVVSLGPEIVPFSMPNLIGVDIETAKNMLDQKNLQEGSIKEEYSDEYKEGIVMNQNIVSGTPVSENTTINLVVSKGPLPVEEPEIPNNNNNNDIPPEENQESEDEDAINTSTNNLITKGVDISLPGHKGTVDILVKRASNGERVVNMKHNVSKNGEKARVNLTGSKGSSEYFELYINGTKYDEDIKINF